MSASGDRTWGASGGDTFGDPPAVSGATPETSGAALETSVTQSGQPPVSTAKYDPQAHGWDEPEPQDYARLAALRSTRADELENVAQEMWNSASGKYEWSDEYGNVGPEIPELEAQLFDRQYAPSVGDELTALTEISVIQEGPQRVAFIRRVSLHLFRIAFVLTSTFSLRMPVFTQFS